MTIRLLSLWFLSWFTACWAVSSERTWDPRHFGAQGDGRTLDTSAIQRSIDAAAEAGGGVVVLADGKYVSGTILLKDGVTLEIAGDATLLGSEDPRDYFTIDAFTDATGQVRGKCLIGATDVSNVGLRGEGTIDGRGESFKLPALRANLAAWGLDPAEAGELAGNRPFLVRFVRCREVSVRDLHLRQPAAWTVHFFQCESIHVEGIRIYSHAHGNNDGIDLDSSRDAVITGCDIDTGDDAICLKSTSPRACENVRVSRCRLKSNWGAIKFGTESMGDFRNVLIEDCEIHDTRGGGIKILSVDGARISDVTIRRIRMEQVDMPLFIRLGERRRTYRDAPQQPVGSIDRISISEVTAVTRDLADSRVSPPAGIFLTGTPDHSIGLVRIEDFRIRLPGGGTAEQSLAIVPEDETRYPEFTFFGVLPAYGLMARHVESLELNGVEFVLDAPDARRPVQFDDVDRIEVSGLRSKPRITANNCE